MTPVCALVSPEWSLSEDTRVVAADWKFSKGMQGREALQQAHKARGAGGGAAGAVMYQSEPRHLAYGCRSCSALALSTLPMYAALLAQKACCESLIALCPPASRPVAGRVRGGGDAEQNSAPRGN
jgi:hypothetical protein